MFLQRIHRRENPVELLRRLGVPPAAGDDAIGADARFVHFASALHNVLRIKQFIGFDAGVVPSGLGAEPAVLRTDAGLGVDDRTGHDLRRELVPHLVGQ
ncbi:hypothetical protein SDC9_173914 [bioreactor metagenome]|uniref:Transposase DDE domain-containing protein n=1 Tax=bioreactor metagenome TaxID=1076179 RepID=A0A645GKV4_9ZZZZ